MTRRGIFRRIGQSVGLLIGHTLGLTQVSAAGYPGINHPITIEAYHARRLVDGIGYLIPYLPDEQRKWFLQSEAYATLVIIQNKLVGTAD